MHFRIAYHSDDGKDQIYTNAPELSVEEMKPRAAISTSPEIPSAWRAIWPTCR